MKIVADSVRFLGGGGAGGARGAGGLGWPRRRTARPERSGLVKGGGPPAGFDEGPGGGGGADDIPF